MDLLRRLKYRHRYGADVKIREDTFISRDVTIAPFAYIGRRCEIANADIGRYVSIANNVSIGLSEHPLALPALSHHLLPDRNVMKTGRVSIAADAWIGAGAVIRQGVTIGIGAVIGANAFVNRDVPDFAIFAGVPARFLRLRFPEDRIAELLQSKWWDSDPAEARAVLQGLR